MPELPEVETVRRGLAPLITGKTVTGLELRRPDLRFPLPSGMAERLTGQTIAQVGRRAKYLLLDFSSDETLLVHLGMSGRFVCLGPGDPDALPSAERASSPGESGAETALAGDIPLSSGPGGGQGRKPAHDHVLFALEGGLQLIFNDPRRFGFMEMMPTGEREQHKRLVALGPEPLSNGFSEALLADRFAGRRSPVKTALLDQHIVAGLGNIYVCEALFRAGIHPARPCRDVTPEEIARLVPAIRQVLEEAIAAGGSSLRDYVQASGEMGYFQHRFAVYGRAGQPCGVDCNCGEGVQKLTQSGRSSFFCPQKQS